MKFFLVIGKSRLYTYVQNGKKLEQQYIEGSECFSINPTNVSEDINAYMEILANEQNLGTIAKLEFDVLEGSDSIFSKAIVGVLGEHICKLYVIDEVLRTVLKKLSRDKKLMIDKYGINYEGYSYKIENNNIIRNKYDLLAYTLHSDDMISLMDI